MAKGVLTSYIVNGNTYSSYILGNSLKNIRAAVKKRRLGEIIESRLCEVSTLPDYDKLSDDEFAARLPEILHAACYISYVAVKSGQIEIDAVIGDEGLLHELAHNIADIEGCNKKSLSCVRDLLKKLQKNAIGFYEPV